MDPKGILSFVLIPYSSKIAEKLNESVASWKHYIFFVWIVMFEAQKLNIYLYTSKMELIYYKQQINLN